MDFNPLSLLEVTMGSDPIVEDDECMIIEDSPPSSVAKDEPEIYRQLESVIYIEDDPLAIMDPTEEPEIFASAGVHFLQQEDPLAIKSPSNGITTSFAADLIAKNAANLSRVSSAEFEYRKSYYKDVQDVLLERLHCTICQEHVGCDIRVGSQATEHPLLKVLVCEKCCAFYKMLQFPLSKMGKDIQCRWCGKLPRRPNGTSLRHCRQCPYAFCELCLFHNVPEYPTKTAGPWVCFGCDPRSIWSARCMFWTLQKLKSILLSTPSVSSVKDHSHCAQVCKKSKGKAKTQSRVRKIVPKSNIKILQLKKGQTIVLNKVNTNGHNGNQLRQALTKGSKVKMKPSGLAESSDASKPLSSLPQPSTDEQSNLVSGSPLNNFIPFPPSLLPAVDNRLKMNTGWFCSKVENYEKDLLNLVAKLKKMREDSLIEDTIQNITTRVETVTTLLSLNSALLKDCGVNLMHEWKEKRSRFEIDNINVNITPNNNIATNITPNNNNITTNITPNNNNITTNIIPNNNNITPKASTNGQASRATVNNSRPTHQKSSPRRKQPTKVVLRKQHNGSFSLKKDVTLCHLELEALKKQFRIKPCSVRLTKIPSKVLDEIRRRGSFIVTGIVR